MNGTDSTKISPISFILCPLSSLPSPSHTLTHKHTWTHTYTYFRLMIWYHFVFVSLHWPNGKGINFSFSNSSPYVDCTAIFIWFGRYRCLWFFPHICTLSSKMRNITFGLAQLFSCRIIIVCVPVLNFFVRRIHKQIHPYVDQSPPFNMYEFKWNVGSSLERWQATQIERM